MHQRDRQTDRQMDTVRQQRPRLRIASRGKTVLNYQYLMYRQRLFDYYQFVVGLGQCSVILYLKA